MAKRDITSTYLLAVSGASSSTPTDISFLAAQVSPARKAKALRYQNQNDVCRSLVGEVALQWIFKNKLFLEPLSFTDSYVIEVNSLGKPFFPNLPYTFNITHSGDWVLCALDIHQSMGIDIQEMLPLSASIIKKFSPLEQEFLRQCPETQWLKSFYQIWVMKESYLKATGEGLRIPLNSFSCIPPSTDGEPVVELPAGKNENYSLLLLPHFKGYTGSLCRSENKEVDLTLLTLTDLIRGYSKENDI